MIRNPTPYPSPQARRGENTSDLLEASRGGNTSDLLQASKGGNSSDLSQVTRGGNVPLSARGEGGRGVRFYTVIDEETQ